MSGPVLDERDQLLRGGAPLLGPHLVHEIADRCNDIDVRPLAVAADVVRLSDPPVLENRPDRRAMIFDEQPVAHVLSVPVDGQLLALQRVQGHQGNKLLRKLKWPVII